MDACTVRPASVDDAAAVLRCLHAAFERYRAEYTPAAFADTTLDDRALRDRMRRMTVLVAVAANGAIAGSVACGVVPGSAGKEGHLRGMAVAPEWQGHGVATALLLAAEDELRSLGCSRVTLDTTVPLRRAVRFYERHGYRPSGRTSDFFGMPLFEYTKDLGPP